MSGLVAGLANQRREPFVAVGAEGLENLLGGVVVGCDLAQASLVPSEELGADAATSVRRVDEADLPVHARSVRLLVPPHAAVADDLLVDLGEEQVRRRVATIEIRVMGCERLRGLDALTSLTARARRYAAGEARVVLRRAKRPEADAVELWCRRHGAHFPHERLAALDHDA